MGIRIDKNGIIKATGKDANDIFNALKKAYGIDNSVKTNRCNKCNRSELECNGCIDKKEEVSNG